MNSQEKLIKVKEIFLDIGKKMLETSYTLSLRQFDALPSSLIDSNMSLK
jgi:hypothetical protein